MTCNMNCFKDKKYMWLSFILLNCCIILLASCSIQGPETTEVYESRHTETFYVTKIIDGDTFYIETGDKVRLIGINAPEKDAYYYENATERLSSLIYNEEVLLEKDTSDKDRYGRLLRYVYVNKTFVNKVLVEEGYAKSISYRPDTLKQGELDAAEEYAIRNNLGIWTE